MKSTPDANGQSGDIARISPELALVDPELRRRLRRGLRLRPSRMRPPLPVLSLARAAGANGTDATPYP